MRTVAGKLSLHNSILLSCIRAVLLYGSEERTRTSNQNYQNKRIVPRPFAVGTINSQIRCSIYGRARH